MLAEITGATDVELRKLAQRLAARLVIDLAQSARARTMGTGRLASMPMDESGGDLDVDGSIEELALSRASSRPPALDELRVRRWSTPKSALVLLIDRSGSMTGERLAAAAVAAAAAAQRAPDRYAVLAFSDKVLTLKGLTQSRPVDDVVADVFRLRGHGPTDLGLALRAAARQLAGCGAERQRVILLSDCRPTAGEAPEKSASGLGELFVIAPADDSDEAESFARAVGARWVPLEGPSAIPAAFAQLAG